MALPDMIPEVNFHWERHRAIKQSFPRYRNRMLQLGINYSRHVLLVSPLQAAEHMVAMEKIISEGLVSKPAQAQKYAKDHSRHDIQREFNEDDLDAAEAQYKIGGRPPRPPQSKKRKK